MTPSVTLAVPWAAVHPWAEITVSLVSLYIQQEWASRSWARQA